jgi:CRP/FNR family transcriptional regulator, cyclic AMP receptor protein
MAITPEALLAMPLFAGLDDRARQQVMGHVQEHTYPAGHILALEGDPCPVLYIVVRGMVRLRQLSTEGREYVLAYLEPGSCFDLPAALNGGVQRGMADALVESTLWLIPCERFAALLREHPALSLATAHALAMEVQQLSARVRDLALHTVRTRLARFLLTQAEGNKLGSATHFYWTQELIAANIGTVRDVVGRTLRTFMEEGLIRRERGRMVVVDRASLERAAKGEPN